VLAWSLYPGPGNWAMNPGSYPTISSLLTALLLLKAFTPAKRVRSAVVAETKIPPIAAAPKKDQQERAQFSPVSAFVFWESMQVKGSDSNRYL